MHGRNVYYMYMLKITYLFTSVENAAVGYMCHAHSTLSHKQLGQLYVTTIYHNTMKPNIPVID